ncbi:MAG TPA: hypothetical protein PKI01_12750 [Bacteroidales bacterium]|nr:hypothetical protein [Bacteroidales bacterium]
MVITARSIGAERLLELLLFVKYKTFCPLRGKFVGMIGFLKMIGSSGAAT